MEEQGLDGYYVAVKPNVRYLSGFTGDDSGLLITPACTMLLTDGRFTEQAEEETCLDAVFRRNGPMTDAVVEHCAKLGVRRLGMTAANISHGFWKKLEASLDDTEPVALDDGIAEGMRLCKDADEVASIKRSLDLAQRLLSELLPHVRPGRTERWLAARLEFEMRAAGAEGESFDTICAVDSNASKPHAVVTERAVGPESTVMFDWGVLLDGYCSDLTRVTPVGTIPTLVEELAAVVMAAQEAAFSKLKPGNRCGEADAAARSVISEAGYGECFGHGLGHGVGLEVHEGPRLGPNVETALRPGMVVTVEPGIYLPGRAGVRIEEMVLITDSGHEVLSSLPRDPCELPAGRA